MLNHLLFMGVIEAIILGIIQGLTEFLPVSSSGHLEIGKVLLGVELRRVYPLLLLCMEQQC